ncbi:hypothetical protein HDU85_004832 [Gaertneriomyces sp. JEL0708]|nr:hypothetical protein HDU85_004832 [Gaertneriomyces sp. JEL0708]
MAHPSLPPHLPQIQPGTLPPGTIDAATAAAIAAVNMGGEGFGAFGFSMNALNAAAAGGPATGPDEGYEYEVVVRQQPVQARMCGFAKTLERRLIDPPPILQLLITQNGVPITVDYERTPTLICHATLRAEDGISDRALVLRATNTSGGTGGGSGGSAPQSSASATPVAAGAGGGSGVTANASASAAGAPQVRPYQPPQVHYPPQHQQHQHQQQQQQQQQQSSQDGQGYIHHPPADEEFKPYTAITAPPQGTNPGSGEEKIYKTLVGSTVVPCHVLNDLDGRPGMYFVFHDLGVRTRGMYRLFFSVHSVAGLDKLLDPSTSKVRPASRAWASTTSGTFQVYTPAFFPGTMESTDLSRHFARQGMPIHLRHDYAAIRFQPYYKRPSEDQQQQQEPSPQQPSHPPPPAAQRHQQRSQQRRHEHVPIEAGEDTDMDSHEVVTHITTSRPPPGHDDTMAPHEGVLYVTPQQQQELMNQSI